MGIGVRAKAKSHSAPTVAKPFRGSVHPINGVSFLAERPRVSGRSSAKSAIGHVSTLRLFCSYSHKDENLRKQLEIHLKVLHRQGVISSWHDRLIGAGREWKDQLASNLELADIILLLVSADFLASDYCWGVEMAHALKRHEAGTARVIPFLRDVNWSRAPFAKLHALPRDGKPVRQWCDRDAAWRNGQSERNGSEAPDIDIDLCQDHCNREVAQNGAGIMGPAELATGTSAQRGRVRAGTCR
jgi:hypothetical protein